MRVTVGSDFPCEQVRDQVEVGEDQAKREHRRQSTQRDRQGVTVQQGDAEQRRREEDELEADAEEIRDGVSPGELCRGERYQENFSLPENMSVTGVIQTRSFGIRSG